MFNQVKLTNYSSRSEYDARPGYERGSPGYDEMLLPGRGEKVTAPKRFWTRARLISAVVLGIVILGGIVCITAVCRRVE